MMHLMVVKLQEGVGSKPTSLVSLEPHDWKENTYDGSSIVKGMGSKPVAMLRYGVKSRLSFFIVLLLSA